MADSFLTDRQLAARYRISRPTLWRWVAQGRFPNPVKLGPQTTRWRAADVDDWEAQTEAEGASHE